MESDRTPSAAWEREEGVTCVVCPSCAFTFDAFHTDADGSYSCPVCEIERLRDSWNKSWSVGCGGTTESWPPPVTVTK